MDDLPTGQVNTFIESGSAGAPPVSAEDVATVSFTGSTATGRAILDAALETVAQSAVVVAGQFCMTGSRPRAERDRRRGPGRRARWTAVGRPPGVGAFYAPTLLEVADSQLPIVQHEIFGPVRTVQRFATEHEAVALANDTEYGPSRTPGTTPPAAASAPCPSRSTPSCSAGHPDLCKRLGYRSGPGAIPFLTLVTPESVHSGHVLDLPCCRIEDPRYGPLLGQVRHGGEMPFPPNRAPCAKIGLSRTARRGGISSWACVHLRRSRTPRPLPRHAGSVGSRTIAQRAGGTPPGVARLPREGVGTGARGVRSLRRRPGAALAPSVERWCSSPGRL